MYYSLQWSCLLIKRIHQAYVKTKRRSTIHHNKPHNLRLQSRRDTHSFYGCVQQLHVGQQWNPLYDNEPRPFWQNDNGYRWYKLTVWLAVIPGRAYSEDRYVSNFGRSSSYDKLVSMRAHWPVRYLVSCTNFGLYSLEVVLPSAIMVTLFLPNIILTVSKMK